MNSPTIFVWKAVIGFTGTKEVMTKVNKEKRIEKLQEVITYEPYDNFIGTKEEATIHFLKNNIEEINKKALEKCYTLTSAPVETAHIISLDIHPIMANDLRYGYPIDDVIRFLKDRDVDMLFHLTSNR